MTVHLNKFVDRMRGHESRASRDFVMSMADAKDMLADITRLLLELHHLREQASKMQEEQVIEVKIGGGSF